MPGCVSHRSFAPCRGTCFLESRLVELSHLWTRILTGHDMPGVKISLQFNLCMHGRHPDMYLFFKCNASVCQCCELGRFAYVVVSLYVYMVSEELRPLRPATSSKTLFQNAFGPSLFFLFMVHDTVTSLRSLPLAVFSRLELTYETTKFFNAYH